MSGSHLCIPRNETVQPCYFQNRIIMFCLPIPTLINLWEIYIFPGSVCLFLAAAEHVDWSWEYLNRWETHECRNWDWGRVITLLGIHNLDFRYRALLTILSLCVSKAKPHSQISTKYLQVEWLYSVRIYDILKRSTVLHAVIHLSA
jgi:hypothetical protein